MTDSRTLDGHTTAPDTGGSTTLRGWRLLGARMAWVAIAIFAVGLVVAHVPELHPTLSTVCTAAECESHRLTPEKVSELEDLGVSIEFYAGLLTGWGYSTVALWLLTGALIFWRQPQNRTALFASVTLVAVGGTQGSQGADVNAVLAGMVFVLFAFSSIMVVTLFFVFPDGRFVPRWTRPYLIVWAVFTVVKWGFFADVDNAALEGPYWGLTYLTPIVAQVYRFRKVSTPLERQQTKWVMLGIAASSIGVVVTYSILDHDSVLWGLVGLPTIMTSLSLIPLSIAFSMLRYRLWDLEIFVKRALVYGLLTAVLVASYFGIVIGLQAAFRAATGQESAVAVVASTLAIAALFLPLRRRIQDFIDRRFYRRRYDAARTLASFAAMARDEVDLERLSTALVGVVRETMAPAHVSLWLRKGDARPQRSGG